MAMTAEKCLCCGSDDRTVRLLADGPGTECPDEWHWKCWRVHLRDGHPGPLMYELVDEPTPTDRGVAFTVEYATIFVPWENVSFVEKRI